jgi:DNA-binding winged helix-turn-helix (wHTH) protein
VKVRFGQFELDSETRQLLRDGDAIHLSPKAFAVLNVLLAKRPNVVPKADLFGEIWPDVFVVDGNLNVLVGEIRRAIDDDPQSPRFIRTVHGIGYAFCGNATDAARATRGEPAPGPHFWLEWKARSFALSEGDNVIGRDPRSDVWVDHSSVSRRHAQIRVASAGKPPQITDLESTNGTFVRGKRIAGVTPLTDGDIIKVGSVQVKFREWTTGEDRTRRIRGARALDRQDEKR